jgi:hypothetical protein
MTAREHFVQILQLSLTDYFEHMLAGPLEIDENHHDLPVDNWGLFEDTQMEV